MRAEMMSRLLLPLVLVSCEFCGKESAPEPKSLARPFLKRVRAHEVISFKPVAAHHFNSKAPNKCDGSEPLSLGPRSMSCQFDSAGPKTVQLAICDDPESFCKIEKHQIEVVGGGTAKGSQDVKTAYQPRSHKKAPPGFLSNDYKKALELAKKGDELLLIDFYGIWCPPCNMLDELVFNSPEFQKLTSGMVRIALDADSDLSWEWKEHFKVGGYPTIVVANSKLQEIGRIVGYRPLAEFNRQISKFQRLKYKPIESVLADPASALRVARWHNNRKEYKEVSSLLEGKDDGESRKLYLQTQLVLAKSDKERVEHYESLISDFPSDFELPWWIGALKGLDEKKATPLLGKALASIKSWRKNPKLEEKGYTAADLWATQGWILSSFGNENESKAAYSQAADEYANIAKQSQLSISRGANLERAYCLVEAGRFSEAKKLYESMVEEYPREFTFQYYYARALHKLGENQGALNHVEKAIQHSYGDNWLRAVALRGKLRLALGDKKLAKKELETALSEAVVPKTSAVRTHRYLGQIREILRQIEEKS